VDGDLRESVVLLLILNGKTNFFTLVCVVVCPFLISILVGSVSGPSILFLQLCSFGPCQFSSLAFPVLVTAESFSFCVRSPWCRCSQLEDSVDRWVPHLLGLLVCSGECPLVIFPVSVGSRCLASASFPLCRWN
jgi:hypothetical protein